MDPRQAENAATAIESRAADRGDVPARLRLAVRLLDLTTLNETDTDHTVRALCAQALRPLAAPPRTEADDAEPPVHVAAVCVYDRFVHVAREALAAHDRSVGPEVRVAAVTGGFPRPHDDHARRLDEVRSTVDAGADEIDAVVTRAHVDRGDWDALYREVRDLREACGPAHLKTILAAGELGSLHRVARAGLVCCMAGADLIKTSTGREAVNATLPIGLAMSAAIGRYLERSGQIVGLKAAGGIRTPGQALAWLQLAEERLGGTPALTPSRFRIGASSLLDRIRTGLGHRDPLRD